MSVWCILYVVNIVLVGCALLTVILGRDRRSLVETVGLALLLGTGAVPTVLLWLSMLGKAPSRMLIMFLGVISAGALIAMRDRCAALLPALPSVERGWPGRSLIAVLIAALLAANLAVWAIALGLPIIEWDSFAIWGLKAKVLYFGPLSPRPDYFGDLRFAYSHLEYPLLLPMLTAGAYAMMGQVNDQLGKIMLPVLFGAQTLVAYAGARIWLSRIPSLALTLLLVGAPASIMMAGIGIADVPLATFHLGAIVYLARWVGSRNRADLVLTAIFAAYAAMTKSEGMALAVITALLVVTVAIHRRDFKSLGQFTAINALGIGIWLIWVMGVPHVDENYASRLTYSNIAPNLDRLQTILPAFAHYMTDTTLQGGLWIVLILMTMLGFRALANSGAQTLWALLLLHLALYAIIYIVTPWEVRNLIQVSLARLLVHVAPNAMLLIAVHWAEVLKAPATSLVPSPSMQASAA